MDQHSRIEIIGIQQSNFVRAVRIACEEKSIEYDHYPDRPHSAAVAAIHPLGKVPVMRHGEFTLAESWPIVAYLDRIFPATPMMHADTTELTAEIEQWVSILVTAVDQVLVRKYAFAYLFPGTPDGAVNRAAVDEVLPKMEALITTLDARVAPTGFLAAGKFTFADALLLATLDAVRRLPEGGATIEAAPSLSSYVARHCARASLIKTDPWIGGDK